jgi:hypothetical protein
VLDLAEQVADAVRRFEQVVDEGRLRAHQYKVRDLWAVV